MLIYVENLLIDSSTIRLEEFKLSDLQRQDLYLSDFTRNTKNIRKTFQKTASANTKFMESIINDDGSVTFKFLTEATEDENIVTDKQTKPAGAKDTGESYKFKPSNEMNKKTVKYEVDPKTKRKKINPSHIYEIQIKVMNVLPNDRDEGLLNKINPEKVPLKNKDLKAILKQADIKIWSSDPSFLFQGFQYWLTMKGASIYSETRRPRRWNKIHGDGKLLTKHIAQLLDNIEFYLNQMTSSFNNKLKQIKFFTPPPKKPTSSSNKKEEPVEKEEKPVKTSDTATKEKPETADKQETK